MQLCCPCCLVKDLWVVCYAWRSVVYERKRIIGYGCENWALYKQDVKTTDRINRIIFLFTGRKTRKSKCCDL